jgi:cytochrome c biogenesis protein CcdA
MFTLGAMTSATAATMAAAAVGAILPRAASVAIAAAIGSCCLSWHVLGRPRFRFRRLGVQFNRAWVQRGPLGPVYFGALLGLGIVTELSTPLVYANLALAAANGVGWAIAAGAGFGLGRSVPPILGALGVGRATDPGRIPHLIYFELRRPARLLGVTTALGGLAALAATTPWG